MQWKQSKETEEMQQFETRYYNQTVIKANLTEEMEKLQDFLGELIRRHQGDKSAEDQQAFEELC